MNLAWPNVTSGRAFSTYGSNGEGGRIVYLVLLVIFLIQFLVVLAALMFAVFLARPEVPFLAGRLSGSDHY